MSKNIRAARRGLYSLVDWNSGLREQDTEQIGRGLYSLVDWNGWEGRCRKSKYVEAYIVPLIEYFFCKDKVQLKTKI